MRILCDFDGTITQRDTTDLVLASLAGPGWEKLEEDWLAGAISAAQCMRDQIALIGGGQAELDAALDGVELDPGFAAFVAWCAERRIPITVVSDGVDYFIRRILGRHGLSHLPVIANRLAGRAGAWRLEQPWSRSGCAAGSGVCKCEASRSDAKGDTVYVGDGRSDFCVAGRADILFAKDALAKYAAARAQAFIAFDTFDDVTRSLAQLLDARAEAGARTVAL